MIELLDNSPQGTNKRFLLFLGNGAPSLSKHKAGKVPEVKKMFKGKDYVYLPISEIEDSLEPDMLEYMFPWGELEFFGRGLEDKLRQKYDIGEKAGLLCINGSEHVFYPIDEEARFCYGKAEADIELDMSVVSTPKCAPEPVLSRKMMPPSRSSKLEIISDEEPLVPNAQSVVEAWEQFSRQYGVTIDDLAQLLNEQVKFSRIIIKPSGAMFLADYGNREVKMDDLTKALYFFYLLHPEGVRQKDLVDYKKEILELYLRITRRDDLDEIKQSVDSLLFDENRVNVSLSRIKKAFRDVVGDWVAKSYYVDGSAGNARSVKLDRDFVIWEP